MGNSSSSIPSWPPSNLDGLINYIVTIRKGKLLLQRKDAKATQKKMLQSNKDYDRTQREIAKKGFQAPDWNGVRVYNKNIDTYREKKKLIKQIDKKLKTLKEDTAPPVKNAWEYVKNKHGGVPNDVDTFMKSEEGMLQVFERYATVATAAAAGRPPTRHLSMSNQRRRSRSRSRRRSRSRSRRRSRKRSRRRSNRRLRSRR